jgi:hypothetical protein
MPHCSAEGKVMAKIELSRQRLYDLIWSAPIKKVAAEIDSSYERIVRACATFDIPRPPAGYWAQLKYNVPISVRPTLEGDANKSVWLEVGVRERLQRSADKTNELSRFKSYSALQIPSRLSNPHPAVKEIMDERKRGYRSPGDSGFIHKRHSSRIDEVTTRIFRILDCLAKALSREGFSVAPHRMDGIQVDWKRGQTIFRLKEQLRMPRDPNGKIIRSNDFVRTGLLFSESPHRFQDEPGLPIEDQMRAIAESISATCLNREKEAEEREERAQRIEARRALLLAERRAEKLKSDAIEKMLSMSEQWHQANRAREFLLRIESLPLTSDLYMGLAAKEWIELLRARIEDLDPIKNGLSGLLARATS